MIKIKVCGMRNADNIRNLVQISPDLIGFIFYPESKRYVGEVLSPAINSSIPSHILKVGVFVDEPIETLILKFRNNQMDFVQLHGNEHHDYCLRLKEEHIPVIKAFKIFANFNFKETKLFESACEYFLFDTAGIMPGGSGIKFEWSVLDQYEGNVPFFLSGGIKPTDIDLIRRFSHPKFLGIDLNSGFEVEPGLKDVSKLEVFISKIKNDGC